jgi:hypothetical protein
MNRLSRKEAIWARVFLGAAAWGCFMILGSIARADLTKTVFTTQEDFTGWTGANFIFQPVSSPDFDGSSTNGIGNTTAPGATGTAGSLGAQWISSNYTTVAQSPEEGTNTAVLAALGTGGLIKYNFSTPDNEASSGGYYAIGILLNYGGATNTYYQTFWYNGGIPSQYAPFTNDGSGNITAYTSYTFDPTQLTPGSAYLQFGFIYNSNYSPVNPIYLDDLQIVRPTGDFNFDGHVDARDIAAMESALANPSAYETAHDLTAANLVSLGDVNGDGKFNNADLQAFVSYLIAGHGNISTVPEPASLVLLGLAVPALVVAAARRRRKSMNL